MSGLVVVVMTAMVSLTLWSGLADAQRPKSPKPDPEAGARIYQQNCVSCHGTEGKGDGAMAAQLNPKPADLTSPKTQEKNDAELLEVLKFGRAGTAMPGWMSELDEREMRHVLAYLRSLVP